MIEFQVYGKDWEKVDPIYTETFSKLEQQVNSMDRPVAFRINDTIFRINQPAFKEAFEADKIWEKLGSK